MILSCNTYSIFNFFYFAVAAASTVQGPQSNFEIGDGGDTRHFFLLTLYNFKNIGGGMCPPASPPNSTVPAVMYFVLPIHYTDLVRVYMNLFL